MATNGRRREREREITGRKITPHVFYQCSPSTPGPVWCKLSNSLKNAEAKTYVFMARARVATRESWPCRQTTMGSNEYLSASTASFQPSHTARTNGVDLNGYETELEVGVCVCVKMPRCYQVPSLWLGAVSCA